jgi:hypothetical protein
MDENEALSIQNIQPDSDIPHIESPRSDNMPKTVNPFSQNHQKDRESVSHPQPFDIPLLFKVEESIGSYGLSAVKKF